MHSVLAVRAYEATRRNLVKYVLPVSAGPLHLDQARNDQVRAFLDESDAEWLWLVDSDMGFKEDTLSRLVDAADPEARPVLGALCAAEQVIHDDDGMGGWRMETVYTTLDDQMQPSTVAPDGLQRVGGTGAACLLIHRSTLVAVRSEFGSHWFTCLYQAEGDRWGEDTSFCVRLREIGVPVHVDAGIKTSHHKSVWLT